MARALRVSLSLEPFAEFSVGHLERNQAIEARSRALHPRPYRPRLQKKGFRQDGARKRIPGVYFQFFSAPNASIYESPRASIVLREIPFLASAKSCLFRAQSVTSSVRSELSCVPS